VLWYLSQPIGPIEHETLKGNIGSALRWYRLLLINGLDVVAPYFGLLQALDEFNPNERKLGMHIDNKVKALCDGIVTVGPSERLKLSEGVMEDVADFKLAGKPHLVLTDMAEEEVKNIVKQYRSSRSWE